MTGPEHYLEAEHHLAVAESELHDYAATRDPIEEQIHLAQSEWAQRQAQVHATLALVSATAEPVAWSEAIS